MRYFIIFFIFVTTIYGQKKFETGYFVEKYGLNPPEVTEKMLDVSGHTHASDAWQYFYIENTGKIDSAYNQRNLEALGETKTFEKYRHKKETVFVDVVTIAANNGDTLYESEIIYTDNFKTQVSTVKTSNCTYYSQFNDWGAKNYDKIKCSGDKKPRGTEYEFTKRTEFIEVVPRKKSVVDSNNIRRYYFTPFDSVVADMLIERNKEPKIFNLYKYNNEKLKVYKYGFNVFDQKNPIVKCNYYKFDKRGRLEIEYFINAVDYYDLEKGFELVNYTEYEYDNLGRKTKMITWVKPEPKKK